MTGFEFTVGCPRCGGEVQPVNGRNGPTEAVAVVACGGCHWEWVVSVFLRPLDSVRRQRERERKRRSRQMQMA